MLSDTSRDYLFEFFKDEKTIMENASTALKFMSYLRDDIREMKELLKNGKT